MTDTIATPRLGLPLLAVAQAQKEVTHNEALIVLDALVHAAVEAGPIAAPPMAPAEGQCWIVGSVATGGWAGQDGTIALWTAGGWRFVDPREGMQVIRLADRARIRYEGGAWIEPDSIATPSGGAVIDVEARAAIAALMLAIEAQGLMISG
ncbi:DUF2793 domain-containing protein [Sphingopyxis kveilinensis]|uniref:DUF2793 domain-containing protein n=1 Tax=Sphingopyxis kveilinensis TaxID=3114367 RepID=UPI0030CB9BCA